MGKTTKILLSILFFIISYHIHGQDFPYKIDYYKFINYNKNTFIFKGKSQQQYDSLFLKFNQLALCGTGQIHIFHFGDSHIQADFFPAEMRKRLQELMIGAVSGRGFIFPFSVAKTNGHPDFHSSSDAIWERCKNISNVNACPLGIAGMSITTYSKNANLNITFNQKDFTAYSYNKIRIFYNINDGNYDFNLKNYYGQIEKHYYPELGYVELLLDSYLNNLELQINRKDTNIGAFTLYGLSFENNDPGITYSSVGVNGADTRSFVKCPLLKEQTVALKPDWIIISLGTNDAYPKGYVEQNFFANYDSLLTMIRQVCPNTPILLTTPGDGYRGNKVLNQNNISAREVILKIAEKHHAAVWDFFTVMGGLGSINNWRDEGLTNGDRLHLSRKGYTYQGDLMFNAFLSAYDDFITRNNKQ